MIGFGALLRKELLEQWRTRRLLVVAIVFTAFGIGSPFLARYTPELVKALAGDQFQLVIPPPTIADAISQFLKNVGQAGILTAVLLAMGSVATEKERGTAALILTKPASRGAYLVSKLIGIGTTLAVSLVAAGIGAYIYTALLFEAPPAIGWAAMVGLLLLSLLVYVGLTFLGSVLAGSAMVAAAIGVGGLILVVTLSALPTIGTYTPSGLTPPAQALAAGADAGNVLGPLLANVALVLLLAGAAWFAFRRQEL
jgi:ABC-2 type transport system permease protein